MERYHHQDAPQEKGLDRARQLQGYLASRARWQDTAEYYHSPPELSCGYPAGGSEWFLTETLYNRHDVRRPQELEWKTRIQVYVCFIIPTKAFDSVDQTRLCKELTRLPQRMLSVVR